MQVDRINIDFIGVGAPKCATTWLCDCLNEHPEVNLASNKETHFFLSDNFANEHIRNKKTPFYICPDWENYKKQYLCSTDYKIRGEYSTLYMYDSDAIKSIYRHFPNIKILICLRNPIDLIYSLYWFRRSSGLAEYEIDFDQYIRTNQDALQRGYFYKHIKLIYETFSQKNIFLVTVDEIKEDNKKVLRNLYEFLEVDEHFIPSSSDKKSNETREIRYRILAYPARKVGDLVAKLDNPSLFRMLYKLYLIVNKKEFSYPPIRSEDAKYLYELYVDDIKQLSDLTGVDLTKWLNDTRAQIST